MRKLIAVVTCWLLAFSLGYTFLPTSFSALINWLGPVFGTPLHLIFSTVFLLFADPLKFPVLAIIWASVGLLCGLIMRKRIGSITTAFSVLTAQFLILGLAGFAIFEAVQKSGIMSSPEKILTLLPPVPDGASLSTILNAPIIGDIYQRVQVQGASMQSFSPNAVFDILANTVLLSIAKNIAIVCVAALVGCELGKLMARPFKPRVESFRMSFVKAPPQSLSRSLIIGVVVLLVSSCVVPMDLASVKAATGSYYSETLLGTLTPSGTAIIAANFFDSVNLLKGIDTSATAFTGCVAASLSAQKLSLEAISGDISSFSSQIPLQQFGVDVQQALGMYSILPSTLLILVYKDVASSTAQDRANGAADAFAKEYGVSFTQLIVMPQSMGSSTLSIAVYQSDASFSQMSTAIMGKLPETQRGGIATLMGAVYRAGIFTPGKLPRSANGTVVSTGFINSGELFSIAGVSKSPIGSMRSFLPNVGRPVPFINILSYFASRFHSSPITVHALKFSDILGTDAPIQFSSSTNASTVLSVIPTGNTTKAGEIAAPIIKMATTLDQSTINSLISSLVSSISGNNVTSLSSLPPDLVNLAIETIAKGNIVDPGFLDIMFTSRFPLQLRVIKSVSASEVDRSGTVTVTVSAINDDVYGAKDVTIDDGLTLSSYSMSANLVSASGSTKGSWSTIANGTSSSPGMRTVTYTVRLLNEGTYTLPAAIVTYVYNGVTYIKLSNRIVVNVHSPNALQVLAEGIPYAWSMLARMINMIPAAQGNGSLILMVAAIAIVLIIAVLEYHGFRKWVRGDEAKGKKGKK